MEPFERTVYDSLYCGKPLRGSFPLLDQKDLKKLQFRVLQQVANRGQESQGLEEIFQKSIAVLKILEPAQMLVSDFLRSPFAESYIDLPFVGEGISKEEAFYLFLMSKIPNEEASTVKHEFIFHMMKELTANPTPFFKVESSDISKRRKGYVAVLRDKNDTAYLYASIEGKLFHGPITTFIGELIECKTFTKVLSLNPSEAIKTVALNLLERGMLD